jgi:Recombination endonuclease VII
MTRGPKKQQGVKRNKWGQILCEHNRSKHQCADCGTGGCEHNRRRLGRCRICNPLSWAKHLLGGLQRKARKSGHFAAKSSPEEIVRLSKETECSACGEPLDWNKKGASNTPHLHHNHENGDVLGFIHPTCNQVEGYIRSVAHGSVEKYLRAMFPEVFRKPNVASRAKAA